MKIIAESAFNHNGSLDYLVNLAVEAKRCGADFFTFQVYSLDDFCKKTYVKYEICKQVEINHESWIKFFDECKILDIQLIPCALDEKSFHFCLDHGFSLIKIHATDLLNIPYLKLISQNDCKIILETQCATKRDIAVAVEILENKILALMHGFSNYPTEKMDLNINAIDQIRNLWPQYQVGFADHTLDIIGAPTICLAKEFDFLEKHLTLDRNNRNYDWQVSLEPDEFQMMVTYLNKHSKYFGKGFKHPTKSETAYRDIMYKKYLFNNELVEVKRSDKGLSYYDFITKDFDKEHVIAAIIARLKSERLPRKVLKPFHNDLLIFDLVKRVETCDAIGEVYIATSNLKEDREIVDKSKERNVKVYQGDPDSVIDRMLDLAFSKKAGAVFRITGDNPLTDPLLMKKMVSLYQRYNLEYVRVNNVPFGVSCELFSTSYLCRLYYELENPYQTEYLTWFVMLDDSARKGCIHVNPDDPNLKRVGYSIDYQSDYDRCNDLLRSIKKKLFTDIELKDILNNVDYADLIDLNSSLKLPDGEIMTYHEYFSRLENMNYIIREELIIK